MYKRIIAFCLSAVLLAGGICGGTGNTTAMAAQPGERDAGTTAQEEQNLEQPTGLLPVQGHEISVEDLSEDSVWESGIRPFSAVYQSAWDACSNNYYYNQLTDEEQKFYDALDEMCLSYLEGNGDAVEETSNGTIAYYTPGVSSGSLNEADAQKVIFIFRYANPQYYFLESSYAWYYMSGVATTEYFFCLQIYPKFASGSVRAQETEKIKTQLNTWKSQLDQESGDYAKAKKAQDLINAKVSYNYDLVYSDFADEENEFSQSVYSVFCMDKTVCAGYTLAFEMLCNLAGIDTIAVTSTGHAWDKICLNDSWYNVDLTWDDNNSEDYEPTYWYFISTDAYMVENGGSSHQEENRWKAYLPACTLGSKQDSMSDKAGIPETPVSRTSDPVVRTSSDGKVTITAGESGADAIYYTVDGKTDPAVSSVRCKKYTDAFELNSGESVRAIAVKNANWNSNVVAQSEEKEPEQEAEYQIGYVLNSGKNSSANPTVRKQSEEVILKNPTRTGYTFAGWYTESGFKNKVTKIAAGTIGDLILYAKWTANTYTISFNGNKNTSGKMSALSGRYGTAIKLTANKFARKGYRFAGWNTKANGKGTYYKNGQSVKNLTTAAGGKVTLYAQWSKVKYKITYKLNGGKNHKSNKKAYYVTTASFSLKHPSRKGYTFKGWYKDKKYKTKVTKVKKGSTGNLILYAKWKKK